MARMKLNPTLETLHDQELDRLQQAAVQCGMTFAVTERTTSTCAAVTLHVASMKTPALHGVVTPFGFSLNLADVTRMTGPEKQKLRDLRELMQRV